MGATGDPWAGLRAFTPSRIALGRAGGSLPTAAVLDFASAHAAARDAVHTALDTGRLERETAALGLKVVQAQSRAEDRVAYLQRPDLGRRLDDASRERLQRAAAAEAVDVVVILADGLSAGATQRNGPAMMQHLVSGLRGRGLTLAPATIVRHGRVAIEDEIGKILRARVALILIGERPGLSSPESLGAYFVYDPRPGRTDAERNCISNIWEGGLSVTEAADRSVALVAEALRVKISGIGLKDVRGAIE